LGTALVHDALVAELGEVSAAACVLMAGGALVSGSECHGPAYSITISRAVGVPGSSVSLRGAYDQAPPGSVVIVSVAGDVGGAVIGDIIGHRLRELNVAGVAVDGDIRDTTTLSRSGLAVWSRGVSMRGVVSAEVDVTVNQRSLFGGVAVWPDDLIVADDDGVLRVPATAAAAVLARCRTIEVAEQKVHDRLARGANLVDSLGRTAS
jgi:4-hydroxy-4-methyl-2-oxoglutarate aldolase